MVKAPTKKAKKGEDNCQERHKAVKTKTAAKPASASAKTATKKTKEGNNSCKKSRIQVGCSEKDKAEKIYYQEQEKVTGYGSGGVDVVMSVDQVAKEAASIAANAPSQQRASEPSR